MQNFIKRRFSGHRSFRAINNPYIHLKMVPLVLIVLFFGKFVPISSNIYTEHYDFTYLSKHLPSPIRDCTMCFVEICEHSAVWVPTEYHNQTTCHSITNRVAILLRSAKLHKKTICKHIEIGGITTDCHSNIHCFDKQIYDDILDYIPYTLYSLFDELFPQCLNHHTFKSSVHYRKKQINYKHDQNVIKAYKKLYFF